MIYFPNKTDNIYKIQKAKQIFIFRKNQKSLYCCFISRFLK